jgi:hypothetical protein
MVLLVLALMSSTPSAVFGFGRTLPRFPPPPALQTLPLPVKLAGGLFLFVSSVKRQDKALCQEILSLAETTLRQDPLIQMELGSGLEAGGVFASATASCTVNHQDCNCNMKQFVCEFQLQGGNSWAQARAYGVKRLSSSSSVQQQQRQLAELVTLQVANMDASLNGGWAEIPILQQQKKTEEEEMDDSPTL